MSSVLYLVYPCARSKPNGLAEISSVPYAPPEESVSSRTAPAEALPDNLGPETRGPCVSTGEQHKPPKSNTDTKKTNLRG